MGSWQVESVLKSDALGRVERLHGPGGRRLLRRVGCGGRLPLSAWIARLLLRRERRALAALRGVLGVPVEERDDEAAVVPGGEGTVPSRGEVLLRTWIDGVPLHRAEELAEDFFDHLDELVATLHRAGVCHNDLHKEQNVLVGADGFPWLIDFQLASVHRRRGGLFASRVRDDLRHVQKHRRRYTRAGRGPESARAELGRGHGLQRGGVALVWRKTGKPLCNLVTRRLLRTGDGEERRPDEGPYPRWIAPRGPRAPGGSGADSPPSRPGERGGATW